MRGDHKKNLSLKTGGLWRFLIITPVIVQGFAPPQIGEHVVVEAEGLTSLGEQPRPLGVVKLQRDELRPVRIFEAYSAIGKIHLHQQVKNQKEHVI